MADDPSPGPDLRHDGRGLLERSGLDPNGFPAPGGRPAHAADPPGEDRREDPLLLRRPVHLPRPFPAQRQVPAGRRLADRRGQARRRPRSSSSIRRQSTAPGERIELPLGGLWQVCRFDEQEVVDRTGPTKTLPDAAAAYWMSIPVPGNKFEVKPELRFCHRIVYRTRVDVPAALAGRSFFLRFPSLSLIASVHVNGQYCGWTKAPFAAWECDVTPRGPARPGQRDLRRHQGLLLCHQREEGRQELPLDVQYARDLDGSAELDQPELRFPHRLATTAAKSGILATPSLIVAGGSLRHRCLRASLPCGRSNWASR